VRLFLIFFRELYINGIPSTSPIQVIHYNRSSSLYYSEKPLSFNISTSNQEKEETDLQIAIRKAKPFYYQPITEILRSVPHLMLRKRFSILFLTIIGVSMLKESDIYYISSTNSLKG
jgi:hypothetical protein